MHDIDTLLFASFLSMNSFTLVSVIYIFLGVLVLLLVLIAGFTSMKNRTNCSTELWQNCIAGLINQAVFTDEEELTVERTDEVVRLLQRSSFRNCLVNELIKAAINLSGTSGENIRKLYELLQLDTDSLKKLKHRKEHIRAKGLQELAMMGQVKYVKKIFKLTNNPNELVRNEAQCALLSFYGFVGLRFLNVVAYPISQAQQIQLINKLNKAAVTNFDPLQKWLRSPNESVLIFSLKLAAYYNSTEVYDEVVKCLQSQSQDVKLHALQYLVKVPRQKSADHITSQYFLADKTYKLAVFNALAAIGTEQEIFFVQEQLSSEDDDIKSAAATCLARLHPSGITVLKTQPFAEQHPWEKIFLQIENNRAA